MTKKPDKDQELARRAPRQARALHKVGLILEAATRLIEQGGIEALTTNAIAERAGVSIGTLYQYFKDKQSILDALTKTELEAMSGRVMAALAAPPPAQAGGRIRAVVQAVLASYGGRRKVHRLLMEHALSQGRGGRLNPMYAVIADMFASSGVALPGGVPGEASSASRPLSREEAFVLTQAIAGVMRAMAAGGGQALKREAVEDALVQLVMGYLAALR